MAGESDDGSEPKNVDIEIWVVVDADGDWGVGIDEGEAANDYAEDYGDQCGMKRAVRINLRVALPVPTVVSAEVGPEPALPVSVKVS